MTLARIALDAIAYAAVLFVISIGLSITMGLMRVINMAHGAFAMIGGFVAAYAMQEQGLGYGGALAAAVALTVAIGIPVERLLYRRIYAIPDPLVHALMTIGITYVVVGVVNHVFGQGMKAIPVPGWLSGPVNIGWHTLPAHRLFVIALAAAMAFLLWLALEKTAFGIRLRATVDDRAMAAALGVRTERIFAVSFALSVALAALGGVIGAEILPVEPYYALRYMVTFLVVVCVGGAGSIGGAVLACLALGFADTVSKYLSPEFGEFFFYLTVVAVIFIAPHGFFGRQRA